MSRVDELIKKLCPNGVPFVVLEKLFHIKGGYTPSKSNPKNWETSEIPWFRMEDIRENGPILDKALSGVSPVAVKNGQLFPADSLIVATSATIGEHALIRVPYLCNQRFVSLQVKEEFQDLVDIKFLHYYAYVLDEWCLNNTTRSSFASVRMKEFKRFKFPIPPLEIQQEIVRILDNFTQLEAELEAELEARRKQYSFYKNALFSFGDDVKFHELGDICESITAGGDRPKRYCKGQTEPTDEFPYPIYSNGTGNTALYGYTDQFKISEPAVTISARGTIGAHSVRSACFTPIVRLLVLIPDSKLIDLKFLNYVLDVTEIGYSGGSIPQLTVPKVKRLRIPLPPLEEQRRIVAILDKFDALVNDISTGLPAEIAARRKQYEYYRDKLLSFEPV